MDFSRAVLTMVMQSVYAELKSRKDIPLLLGGKKK
jgi:hypothetical protein